MLELLLCFSFSAFLFIMNIIDVSIKKKANIPLFIGLFLVSFTGSLRLSLGIYLKVLIVFGFMTIL